MTDAHAAPEEEPQSPSWLPALGIAFFVVAGVVWSLCTGDSATAAASGAASASAGAGAAAPSPPSAPAH
ncbi:MAG: hypothetical protein ACRENE_14975 [Polyangiaceae bacterium]